MVDLTQLMSLSIGGLERFADDWLGIAQRLEDEREGFRSAVSQPLMAGDKWKGDDATEAARTCDGIQLDIEAVAKEAKAVQRFFDDVATGSGDGFGSLREHRQRAFELQQEALGKGLTVKSDGTVNWVVMRAPGPLSPEELVQQGEKNAQAAAIEEELKRVLQAATDIDDSLTRGLKVIFGTEETFRTENRSRTTDDADRGDAWTEIELWTVRALLDARGWNDAAMLLEHFLEGSGKPVEVDVTRMLQDMPAFRRDVDATLGDIRKQPDGTFQTGWQGSRPNLSEGDKSLNWYYALNNFEYRLVGEKEGDRITYQVEVRKRYDWGIPSEHRRDLEKSVIHFEQAELARLNMVGMAKDFDVHGRTGTMTA